jgi:hypothetical protein
VDALIAALSNSLSLEVLSDILIEYSKHLFEVSARKYQLAKGGVVSLAGRPRLDKHK